MRDYTDKWNCTQIKRQIGRQINKRLMNIQIWIDRQVNILAANDKNKEIKMELYMNTQTDSQIWKQIDKKRKLQIYEQIDS